MIFVWKVKQDSIQHLPFLQVSWWDRFPPPAWACVEGRAGNWLDLVSKESLWNPWTFLIFNIDSSQCLDVRKEKRKELIGISQGASLAKCWDKLDGINTRISMFQDLVWNGVQVLFFGKHCKLKPPLQKFNGKKVREKNLSRSKVGPKKFLNHKSI